MEIGKVYSGKEFNEINKNKKFYKIINEYEIHYGFKYKDGLNIDTNIFNPTNEYGKGGLYFTDLNNIIYYFKCGIYIREVILPDDAQIYVCFPNNYKADKFILKSSKLIAYFDEWNNYEFYINAVDKLGESIFLYLRDEKLTDTICKLAVQQNGLALKYIKYKYKTEDICKLAVQQNGLALQFVDFESRTDEICKLAVQQNGLALQFIRIINSTDEICNIAIQQNSLALRHVRPNELTEEMYKIAIKQNGLTLRYIKTDGLTEDLINELYQMAVQQNGLALKYIKPEFITDELCKIAVQQNGLAFKYVKHQNLTENMIHELYKLAIKQKTYIYYLFLSR